MPPSLLSILLGASSGGSLITGKQWAHTKKPKDSAKQLDA